MHDASLKDKVALVTGASGGVGFEIARKLLGNGARVVINTRSAGNGRVALERLRATSPEIDFVAGDCAVYDDAVRVAAHAALSDGGIDILVCAGAAGTVRPMPFAQMQGTELAPALESRLFPKLFPIHAALPYLRARGGAVVVLGTDAARHATIGESVVGAAGAALIQATKVLAKEFARWNIRVNGVALTLTSGTPSWDRIFKAEGEHFDARLFSSLATRFPFGRPPSAEEVARVAVLLASAETAQVTGQTISVNGGLSFGGW